MLKNFSLKFIDIMVGVILGLGFQWWPNLHEPWQYAAFIFAYLNIIDYWIDYAPSLKKFPPKRELDIMLDVAIMFSLFLYIYATQLTIVYFLTVFAIFRLLDFCWLLRAKYQYDPTHEDRIFVDTWLRFNFIDALASLILMGAAKFYGASPSIILTFFVLFILIMRILASYQYKKVYFT